MFWSVFILNIFPAINSTNAFSAAKPSTMAVMSSGFCAISLKSIDAPTPIKNKPNSKPLNGCTLLYNSCRNSLFANTTPAKKAPKAALKPTNSIRYDTDTTNNKAEAVNNSRNLVLAIMRSMGTTR